MAVQRVKESGVLAPPPREGRGYASTRTLHLQSPEILLRSTVPSIPACEDSLS